MPSVVSWINPAGGDWDTPSNWSTGQLPGTADDVLISVPGNVTITHTTGNDSINSLRCTDALNISGGTLALGAASSLGGSLNFSGGQLAVGDKLSLNGPTIWTSGTLFGPGTTTANGTLTIGRADLFTTPSPTLDGGTLVNSKTAVLTGQNTALYINDGADFINRAGATVVLQGDVSVRTSFGLPGTIDNAGSFRKTLTNGISYVDSTLNNTGTIEVQTGTLALDGGGNETGQFLVDANGTLNFGGGSFVLQASSKVSGPGMVLFTTNVPYPGSSSTIIFGQYTPTGLTTVASNGTVDFESNVSIANLLLSGGAITGAGTVVVTGTLDWSSGSMEGFGTTLIKNGANLTIEQGSNFLQDRTITNAGTTSILGNVSITGVSGTFNNLAGAMFIIQGSGNFGIPSLSGPSTTINNMGTIRKTSGSGISLFTTVLNNSGLIDVRSGTLNLAGDGRDTGRTTVAAGATLAFGDSVGDGGSYTFTGSSSVSGAGNASFQNGVVTVDGVYALTGATAVMGGTLKFDHTITLPNLTLNSGTLDTVSNVTVNGSFDWSGGTVSGPGTVEAAGGLVISQGAINQILDGATLNNPHLTTLVGNVAMSFTNGGTFNNQVGGTFLDEGDAALAFLFNTRGTFNNAGTFLKTLTNGTTFIDSAFNNTGLVEAQSGTLIIGGPGTNSGRFVTDAGATLGFGDLSINGSAYTLAASSSLKGAGNVTFQNGSILINGTYAPTGSTTIGGAAAVNFSHDISFSALSMAGGVLTDFGTVTVTGLLNWTAGTMKGPGTTLAKGGLTMNPLFSFNPLTLDGRTLSNYGKASLAGTGSLALINSAVMNNLAGATFVLTDNSLIDNQFQTTSRLINRGTVRMNGTGGTASIAVAFTNSGQLDVENGTLDLTGPFANYTSVTQTLSGGSYLINGTFQFMGANVVNNAASLTLSGPTAQLVDQFNNNALVNFGVNRALGSFTVSNGQNFTTTAAFNNLGHVTVGANSSFSTSSTYTQQSGTTTLQGGTLTSTGGVMIQAGLLSGPGTVNGNVSNAGQVNPGGVGAAGLLTINGNYTQTSTGGLSIDLGGTQAGKYDQLVVTGTATLAGTLNVNLIGGFIPSKGEDFHIMAFASESGTFSQVHFPSVAGINFALVYGLTGLDIITS